MHTAASMIDLTEKFQFWIEKLEYTATCSNKQIKETPAAKACSVRKWLRDRCGELDYNCVSQLPGHIVCDVNMFIKKREIKTNINTQSLSWDAHQVVLTHICPVWFLSRLFISAGTVFGSLSHLPILHFPTLGQCWKDKTHTSQCHNQFFPALHQNSWTVQRQMPGRI